MPAVFVHRAFALLWCARVLSTLAYHVQTVAVGWQLYELTGSALDLGLVGLVQFVPIAVLALAAGQAADRYDRRAILVLCQLVKAGAAALLALGTAEGWLGRESILAILALVAAARIFETPTMAALVPEWCRARSSRRQRPGPSRATRPPVSWGQPWAASRTR